VSTKLKHNPQSQENKNRLFHNVFMTLQLSKKLWWATHNTTGTDMQHLMMSLL